MLSFEFINQCFVAGLEHHQIIEQSINTALPIILLELSDLLETLFSGHQHFENAVLTIA